MATEYVSARIAAAMIGKTPRRVNQLLVDGDLTGIRIGNSNAVEVKSLDRYLRKRNGHKGGRSRKESK